MERKSIGALIAALRKANGMTQKDLAEKLNISDKSVSRWERDEGAPDLSLIPVIAEIFDVTCDELLRGERKPISEQAQAGGGEKNLRTQKQRQRILAAGLSKYKNRSLIATGIAVTGLIAAMICNFGFNRAYIGFLIGTIFFLAAIICQAIFVNGAFLSVADEDLIGPEVERFKRCVIAWAKNIISLVVVLFSISLPLIMFTFDSHMGLSAESWFVLGGLPLGLLAILLCGVVGYFLTDSLMKRGVYSLTEQETVVYQHNFKLKRHCTLALLALLLITFIGNTVAVGAGDVSIVARGTSFDDYESFQDYMAQDIPEVYYNGHARAQVAPTDAPTQISPTDTATYYDEQGNEITEEEALRQTITDSEGNVVCEYINRNHSVWSIHYGNRDGTLLPITVFTQDDIRDARQKIEIINAAFVVVYVLETIVVLAVYFKKRAK